MVHWNGLPKHFEPSRSTCFASGVPPKTLISPARGRHEKHTLLFSYLLKWASTESLPVISLQLAKKIAKLLQWVKMPMSPKENVLRIISGLVIFIQNSRKNLTSTIGVTEANFTHCWRIFKHPNVTWSTRNSCKPHCQWHCPQIKGNIWLTCDLSAPIGLKCDKMLAMGQISYIP